MSLPTPYYSDDAVTIYHGDCQDILAHLDPVDMVFTDPPYGHNNNDGDLIANREKALGRGEPGKPRPIANDGREIEEILESILPRIRALLRHGGCCCCCCAGGGPDPQFARWSLMLDRHLQFKQMVVWDKGPIGMGWHYRRSYETVLVAEKPGGPTRWFGDERTENIIRAGTGVPKIIPSSDDHPTPKPVQLPAHFIRLHSEAGDTILDPFMGAGTTLRAAKDLGRKAIGIEIEERYCEMAAKRMAQEVLDL